MKLSDLIPRRNTQQPQPIYLSQQAVLTAAKAAMEREVERQLSQHFPDVYISVDLPLSAPMGFTPFEVSGRQVIWR